ncbi:integration host factor subunit beta [Bathymodiolus platifrons methanotrophic gill symbiont]|nr:integration host factor subunit beta [Bathymodiolus platifrons methanotrophic gill symbiont]
MKFKRANNIDGRNITIIIGNSVTKSELIEQLSKKQPHLALQDVELAVKCMLEQMSQALSTNERIEVRGFGSFSLHHRKPRMGRNPKTGESVSLTEKYVPHFKPGKELRDRVDETRHTHEITD